LLYVLTGDDDFSLRQTLEAIKRSTGDESASSANTMILDGQRLTLDQLRNVCETVPFLADKRLVIVEGLMERFERRSRPSQNKKAKRLSDQQNAYKAIADYMTQIPDFTLLVLVDGKTNSQNPLFKMLSTKAEVRSFPFLRDNQLHQWVQRRVTETNGSISPQAVVLLAKFVGGDLWVMANEIDKLILFAKDRRIEEEDVRTMVSYAQEANVFAMVDAIVEFKSGLAEKLLQQLLQQGAAPAYLLVMLARQVRIIVQAKELRNQRKSRVEIQEKLGLATEFVLRKALEQADKYTEIRLKEVYHKLLEADLSIKTGKFDGELALSILIAELCQRNLISTN